MISSPCKNCHRKYLPKDECSKKCELLHAIQDIQVTARKSSSLTGIDYSEESRYSIPLSLTKTSVSLWTA